MKNYSIFLLCALILIITTTGGCNKNKKPKSRNVDIEFNNEVFIKEFHDKIVEIHYWNGGDELVVNKQKDIDAIFNLFSSRKLVEMSSEEPRKVGHHLLDMVTEDDKKTIGMLSGEITKDGKRYSTDKDIVKEVADIAMKYDKK